MKITKQDYATLKEIIENEMMKRGGNIDVVRAYKTTLSKNPKVKDVDKRFRWDLFNFTGKQGLDFCCNTLYKYLDDTHLDSALKAIVKDIYPTI